jgi:hypothetical protein
MRLLAKSAIPLLIHRMAKEEFKTQFSRSSNLVPSEIVHALKLSVKDRATPSTGSRTPNSYDHRTNPISDSDLEATNFLRQWLSHVLIPHENILDTDKRYFGLRYRLQDYQDVTNCEESRLAVGRSHSKHLKSNFTTDAGAELKRPYQYHGYSTPPLMLGCHIYVAPFQTSDLTMSGRLAHLGEMNSMTA